MSTHGGGRDTGPDEAGLEGGCSAAGPGRNGRLEERRDQKEEHINSTRQKCVDARPVRDHKAGLWKMVACGRPKCSRECRDKWAKKNAACAALSFRELPPTHHVVVRPAGEVTTREFGKAISRSLRSLRGSLPVGVSVEYLRTFEWRRGRPHVHLLLRTSADVGPRRVGNLLRQALGVGYRTRCERRRKEGIALAKYVFKDLKNPRDRAELPPPDFTHAKLFVASLRFFVRPMKQLWPEVKAEWRETNARRAADRPSTPPESVQLGHGVEVPATEPTFPDRLPGDPSPTAAGRADSAPTGPGSSQPVPEPTFGQPTAPAEGGPSVLRRPSGGSGSSPKPFP